MDLDSRMTPVQVLHDRSVVTNDERYTPGMNSSAPIMTPGLVSPLPTSIELAIRINPTK